MLNRENKHNSLYELLNRSLDGEITDDESLKLKKALVENPELKEQKVNFIALKSLISQQKLRFTPFFSARVMHRIERLQENTGILSAVNYAFMRISLPTMLALFVWVLVFWGTEGSLNMDGLLGVSELSYDELVNDFFVSN